MDDALEAAGRAADPNAAARPVRIDGDVVTRPASVASASVHSLLRHLRERGLDCVPEPLGIHGGVETFRFIEGVDGGDGWYHQHTDQGIASAARLLRVIHDAGRDWNPPAEAVWAATAMPSDDMVYCHGDPGPWNFIWRDDEAIALIDWDYVHPAPRVDDVAYALRWFAPLRSDECALEWHHFPEIPDRRHRVGVFLEAYGGDVPDFDLVDAVTRQIRAVSRRERALAEQGVEPQRSWVADGSLERSTEEVRWIQEHRDLLT